MSPTKNQVKLAEEYYKKGNVKEAIGILNELTFRYPNTSENHLVISQVLVAYQINWTSLQDGFTHYDILGIPNPRLCNNNHQLIEKKYKDLMAKLSPDSNNSVAAKSAFELINYAWEILSDPVTRRDYNVYQKRVCEEIHVSRKKMRGKSMRRLF